MRALRAEVQAARAAAGARRAPPSREAILASFGRFLDAHGTRAPEEDNAVPARPWRRRHLRPTDAAAVGVRRCAALRRATR